MRKVIILGFIFITLTLFFTISYAEEYVLYGNIYNENGETGDSTTPNSFCSLNAYRFNIENEIGHQHRKNGVYKEKVYDAENGMPSYFLTDVGSKDWLTSISEGQIAVAIVETYASNNGWTGESFVGCSYTTITAQDILENETDFKNIYLKKVKSPEILDEGADYIKIGIQKLDLNFLISYNVYRSEDNVNYIKITTLSQPQNSINIIEYIDNNNLLLYKKYYYKISLNFLWEGTTTGYYETKLKSLSSLPAQLYIPSPTETITPTFTLTPTCSITNTITVTLTPTPTLTITNTVTVTPTLTLTLTLVPTDTFTPTPTKIIDYITYDVIKDKKVIVYPNPVKGRENVNIAFEGKKGKVYFYVYSLTGKLLNKKIIRCNDGKNSITYETTNLTPGVYIIQFVLRTDTNDTIYLPKRKMVILK